MEDAEFAMRRAVPTGKETVPMQRNVLLAAGLTSLMWGLTGIFVRLLPTFPPLTVTAGRLLVALVVVLPILGLFRSSRQSFKSALQHPIAHVLALLVAGYYLLATAAFQMAPVAEVALLLSTPPLFVLFFCRIRGDIPNHAEIGGAMLAVAGIGLILVPKIYPSLEIVQFTISRGTFLQCALRG